MVNNIESLNNWKSEIEKFAYLSKTFSIAIFSIKKQLIYANPAFNSLISNDPVKSLINPTFDNLIERKPDHNIIFKGFITIGNLVSNQSINAIVYRKANEILILGEFEIQELLSLNLNMIELNREINNLQRQLIKEKQVLAHTNEKLEEINNEKNRFLGIAAHDLRNPIGTAMGYAELLSKRYSKLSKNDIDTFLSVIVKSCKFSLNLLNDLLDISKIESGKIELNLSKINYIDHINSIIINNQIIANPKNINIKIVIDKQDVQTIIDIPKIEQVVNNLLSNAIKYSKPDTEIKVVITHNTDTILTEIIDQGQGIPASEIELLFSPFQTTSVKSTSGEKSTGLGLAIVKKIIQEHGGEINVVSAPGIGSNFNFTLPIRTIL